MLETKWLYLGLNAVVLSIPLLRSFETQKVQFYKRFKALFASIIPVAVFFLIWDIWFTEIGIWGFNPKYLSGIEAIGLPLGEYLFFIVVPYVCVFIYDSVNYFYPDGGFFAKNVNKFSTFLMAFGAAMAVSLFGRAYSLSTFLLLAVWVGYLHYYLKPTWLPKLYRAYTIALLGFFFMNGILTGTGIEEPVVWYNEAEFSTRRIGTIPIEDLFYGFILISMNIALYEYWCKRFGLILPSKSKA